MSISSSPYVSSRESGKSRKWKALLIVLGILAILWVWISPFMALYRLVRAVQTKDAEELETAIDFPSVREGLKADVSTMLLAQAKPSDGFEQLGAVLGNVIVARVIDTYGTPQGLLYVIARKEQPTGNFSDFLGKADWHYDSWGRFSVIVAVPDGKVKIVFVRSALVTWRVHSVYILDLAKSLGSTAEGKSPAQQAPGVEISPALRQPAAVEPSADSQQPTSVEHHATPGCLEYDPAQTFVGYIKSVTFAGPPTTPLSRRAMSRRPTGFSL